MGFYYVVLATPEASTEKITQTVVQIQQETIARPWKKRSQRGIFLPWMENIHRQEKTLWNFQNWHRQVEQCCLSLPNQWVHQRYWIWSEVNWLSDALDKMKKSIELQLHVFQVIDETTVHNWNKLHQEQMFSFEWAVSILTAFKRIFWHNSVRNNLFLGAGKCWNDRTALLEKDQKIPFRRIFGDGDSYFDFVFCCSKVSRLHARLTDATAE